MNDLSTQANSGRNVLSSAALLLFCYVLSVDPVVKLALDHNISSKSIETIYSPLVWLCHTEVRAKTMAGVIRWHGERIWRWSLPPK